jgi:hypothetical protein
LLDFERSSSRLEVDAIHLVRAKGNASDEKTRATRGGVLAPFYRFNIVLRLFLERLYEGE